jgi:hypothetical protein
VAVNLADCPVNHDTFHVGVIGDGIKNPFENISFHPMAEALENGVPVAKRGWKITPRGPGSGNPQDRFHEKTPIPAGATGVAFLAKTMRLHQSPLRITDHKSLAQHHTLLFWKE